MSLINELSGKLVHSFLTLDDLVLSQSLTAEGDSQFDRLSRTAAGSMIVGANLAARTVHLGIQVGAKTAGVAAGTVEGLIPGAGAARRAAEDLNERSKEAGSRASQLAAWAIEMAGGPEHGPRDPLTGGPWLSAGAPSGYTWRELAADTALGPWGKVAGAPLTVALGVATRTASTDAGQKSLASAVRLLTEMREMIVAGESPQHLDTGRLREQILTVSTNSGAVALREISALAEASARLAFGDPRRLHDSMQDVLESLRSVVAADQIDELLPAVPISQLLQERAREVLDNSPEAFLEALRGEEGAPPKPEKILLAMVENATELRTFLVQTPQILTLMGMNAGLVLGGGLADAEAVELWLNNTEYDDEHDSAQPWSLRLIEDLAGKASVDQGRKTAAGVTGMISMSAIRFGQDAAFLSVSEVLGREGALQRAQTLYGKTVRERLEADPSLDRDVLDLESTAEIHAALNERLKTYDARELSRIRDVCDEQLASLRSLTETMYEYQPRQPAKRVEILELFLTLVGRRLALGPEDAADARRESMQAFEQWAS